MEALLLNDWTEELQISQYEKPTYENFIGFVKAYIAPHMEMSFVEEKYYKTIWDKLWEKRFTLVELPRGHSKSEFFGIWLTVYLAIFQPKNPFSGKKIIQQLIISSDQPTTGLLFDRVKDAFLRNDTLQKYCPMIRKGRMDDHRWNSEKIELRNGSTIYRRSVKTKRGLHVDRILVDDPTTEASTLKDKETWDFFTRAITPMAAQKSGMVQLCGTPLRYTDILTRILNGDAGPRWNTLVLPAILDWESKKVLSPQRMPWERLMEEKERIGSVAFQSEYMLNPIDDSTSLIKREWIVQCYDANLDLVMNRKHYDNVFLGVDFAFSDRETADYSVFAILGKYNEEYTLLNYHRVKGMSALEQLDYIRELHAIHKFDLIGLEENSIKSVVKEVKKLGLPIKLFRTANIDERDKKRPDFQGVINVKKEGLAIRLGATFENKGIKLPYKSAEAKEKMTQLLNECVSWQLEDGKLVEVGEHPDIPIALGYAFEVANKSSFIFTM